VSLREPAADVKRLDIGQALFPQRADVHDLRTGRFQSLDIFGVVELKGGVPQDADAR